MTKTMQAALNLIVKRGGRIASADAAIKSRTIIALFRCGAIKTEHSALSGTTYYVLA